MEKERENWTIGSILTWTKQYFGEKGVENPRLDAEVLLSHILGKDRLYLYVHFDQPLDAQELADFRVVVKQRALRVPVAYIVGYREFMGLSFMVTQDVLIPRPDTEILVEAALTRLQNHAAPAILDIGSGSGAIIISILHKLPQSVGTAIDISPQALAVVAQNAAKHQVTSLELLCGDIMAPVQGRCFDAILSNPPYIPADDIAALEPEVRKEPRLALAGGADGLDFYRRILSEAPDRLSAGGFIALEAGAGQAGMIVYLAEQAGIWKVDEIIKDYGGIERVVILSRK